MITPLYIFLIVLTLCLVALVWILIKKGQLRPRYALLWLILSGVFLTLAIFRGAVQWVAKVLKVEYAPSLFFVIGIIFLSILVLHLTTIISDQSKRNTELMHRSMLLQWRLEKLEEQTERDATIFYNTLFSMTPDDPSKVKPFASNPQTGRRFWDHQQNTEEQNAMPVLLNNHFALNQLEESQNIPPFIEEEAKE